MPGHLRPNVKNDQSSAHVVPSNFPELQNIAEFLYNVESGGKFLKFLLTVLHA